MESSIETDLLDIIYETALDPGFWPLALEGLNEELDSFCCQQENNNSSHAKIEKPVLPIDTGNVPVVTSNDFSDTKDSTESLYPNPIQFNESFVSISQKERNFIINLAPHFNRALKLNRKYVELNEIKEISSTIMDKIPVGIIFLDKHGNVILQNRAARDISTKLNLLKIVEGKLVTDSKGGTKQLQKIIGEYSSKSLEKINSLKVLSLKDTAQIEPISVLVAPYDDNTQHLIGQCSVVLFIAGKDTAYELSDDALKGLYSLTKTESRLAKHLAKGMSIEEYTEKFCISIHTARSQLKSIFSKTNTHSQGGLVKALLTSPSVFMDCHTQQANNSPSLQKAKAKSTPLPKLGIELHDRRNLCFAEYGDPDGIPVLLCHGSYGCRMERYPDDNLTKSLGIRLIVPDRPGFGGSDAVAGRSGLQWCDDLSHLLEALDIERVGVLGAGVGGYYAMACGYQMPERVTQAVLVNSVAPFQSIKEFSGMVPHDKLFFAIARYAPALLKRLAELTHNGLRKNIDWYFNSVRIYGGESDSAMLSDDELISHLKDMVLAAGSGGAQGFIDDMLIVTRDWQFELKQISIPVHIFHGKLQVAIPQSMGERLHANIPNSTLSIVENEGNYLMFSHWQKLLHLFSRKRN